MRHSPPLGESVLLDDAPDAAPTARHFVSRALRGSLAEDLLADVELVVTELVSNALLHVGPPVVVTVVRTDGSVHLEVSDRSRGVPVRGLGGVDSMTGRGLALVAAVSTRWGVRDEPDGKTVWADLGSGSTTDVTSGPQGGDVLPAGGQDREGVAPVEARHEVVLGDVPTDLLLAAKGHVDNLVREFTLAVSGAAAGLSGPVPPRLGTVIERVVTRFSEPRAAIKRQALAAHAAGEERTRLVLTLPLSAADAGRDYLIALDEADMYARAARLLTLETPPQHRAFRQWYVTSLADQLRAIGRGERPAPPPSFEEFLLGELDVLVTAQRVADRGARLQSVTAALAGAATAEEVAIVVLSEGVDALAASGGGVLVPVDDEHLAVPGTVGYDDALVARLRVERRDAPLPAADAVRRGVAVWLESVEDRDARYPEVAELEPATAAMCAVPLIRPGRVLGALRFSFDVPRLFDEDERSFVVALASQTAQALDRSALHESEREARERAETVAGRLTRLHRVTSRLAAARDEGEVADVVTSEAALTLGAVSAALAVVDASSGLRVLAVHGVRADVRDRWWTVPLEAAVPAAQVVRTNRPVVARSRAELESSFPALRGALSEEGSLVCVPVASGDRPLGALSMGFPAGHVTDADELDLLTSIGQQCSVALERVWLLTSVQAAQERAAFLADATARLASSLEPAETMQHLTGLLVPELADWAVVYLVGGDSRVVATAAAHRDPGVSDAILRGYRARGLALDAQDGLGEVLRTGRTLRYARVPDPLAARIAAYVDEPAGDVVRPVRSAMGVPLTGPQGRVIGALGLVRTRDDPYTEDDQRLVEAVAVRAAVAVDHAEAYRRERDAAVTLQHSLLPQAFPRVHGISVAWRYLPGSAGTHIGGDWYDVIPLERGRVALVIGDVMGRGLRAAAVMGQLRATVRAHVSADVEPSVVLARLDAALLRLEHEQITTVLLGVLDPATRSLTVASAGHLPPLVTSGDGSAGYLDVEPGPPLGAGYDGGRQVQVTLPAGATVLFFTDGLVEDRTLPVDRGLDALLSVASATTADPERLCDRALAALGRDVEHDDDTAVLAVHLPGP